MTFLHWSFPSEEIRALLPEGIEPDTFEDRAWVGLTPFRVIGFRLPFMPPMPLVSNYPETNLRTYVRLPDGQDAIWFFTLDVESFPTVLGARAVYGMPFRKSSMTVDVDDNIRYRSRRSDDGPSHDIVVVPGDLIAEDELTDFDNFLTGRWRTASRHAGRIWTTAAEHEPWPLRRATVERADESYFASVGLEPAGAPVVHFSPGVDARLGFPRPAGRANELGLRA